MNDHQLRLLRQAVAQLPDGVFEAIMFAFSAWMVTYPAGWLVAWMMQSKRNQLEAKPAADDQLVTQPQRGFPDGGAVIGRLERLLIYLFVLSDAFGAVGFLIAAKSIFRFGELSDQKNRLEAEYITIGTLTSFCVGLAIALVMRQFAATP